MKILDFPELRQTYEYDCGAKVLQAVLVYYGVEVSEGLIVKHAKTSEKSGTSIKNILNVLRRYGLKFDSKVMSIKELKNYIDKKIPVIILLQAWSLNKIDYTHHYNNGHFVVAIGYDNDKIIFEDPYSFTRAFLTEKELESRWHGKDNRKKIVHWAAAVYGKNPHYDSSKMIHMD